MTQPPLLRIVKGDPSPEELAALVSVVSALGGKEEPVRPNMRSEWSAHHHKVRGAHRHGPGTWRYSGR